MRTYLNLFLLTEVSDYREFLPENPPQLEFQADQYLKECREWFGGRTIQLYENELCYVPQERSPSCLTSQKVIQFIKCAIFAVLGVFFKLVSWMKYHQYIRKRNELLFQLLEERNSFSRLCQTQNFLLKKPSKWFSQSDQMESPLCRQAKDIQFSIMYFFDRKEFFALARTCKHVYLNAYQFREQKLHPPNIFKQILVLEFAKLPDATLSGDWQNIFYQTKKLLDYSSSPRMNLENIAVKLMNLTFNRSSEFLANMQRKGIQKIATPEGLGFLIQFKDATAIDRKERFFVVAKINRKWAVITHQVSPAMWLFLNQIGNTDPHGDETPPFAVVGYFRRLLNGLPCGNFPTSLNRNVQRADQLQEGPTLSESGEPVIQLSDNNGFCITPPSPSSKGHFRSKTLPVLPPAPPPRS